MKLNNIFLQFFAVLIVLGFVLAGCVHQPVPPLDDNGNNNTGNSDTSTTDTTGTGNNNDTTATDPCDPDSVYFANDILPLLNSSCGISGCHDPATAEDGVVLTDYNSIISTGDVSPGDPQDSEIYENITESDPDKQMPPPSSGITLSQDQINMIYTWIAQGAQNNDCDPNAGGCDTANMSYQNDIVPVLTNNCLGCHSGSNPQGNISLDNFNSVKNVVNSGQLEGAITWTPGYTPMPYNQSQLNDCTIDKIKSWINDGAPNN